MNSLSIHSNSFLPPLVTPKRAFANHGPRPNRSPRLAHIGAANPLSPAEDRVTGGLSLGLIALTLPTVGYAFYQLWQLVGGDTLHQAVRAFAP